MKVECPKCAATGNIDESRITPQGRDITCPRCKHRFHVLQERSGVEIIQQRETMGCPKCGSEQPVAPSCAACGIVVQKYTQAQAKLREREGLETAKLKSDLRRVDAWYSDLLDRRLSSMLVRVLSLLLLVGLFMIFSMKNARRSRIEAANVAEMKRANEGPVRAKPDEWTVLADLHAYEGHLQEAAYNCLHQCDQYSVAWYSSSEPGGRRPQHRLDSGMADQMKVLHADRSAVSRENRSIRAPSDQQYFPYYYKVKGLYNIYDSFYSLASNPGTHYTDFHARVSQLNSDLQRTLAELEEIRPKQPVSSTGK